MTRRRPPRGFPQRVTTVFDEYLPGNLAGRSRGASPMIDDDSGVAAASIGMVGSVIVAGSPSVVDLFQYDTFTLAADGAQTKTLSQTPLDASTHVYLNGIEQLEGTDFTISDTILSILAGMDALTDDVVDVRYAYATDIPDTAETG